MFENYNLNKAHSNFFTWTIFFPARTGQGTQVHPDQGWLPPRLLAEAQQPEDAQEALTDDYDSRLNVKTRGRGLNLRAGLACNQNAEGKLCLYFSSLRSQVLCQNTNMLQSVSVCPIPEIYAR